MPQKIYLNGKMVNPEDAKISIFDRGFLYGDSVYETLRVYQGTPFAFNAHIERLFASGQRVGFTLPWTQEHVRSVVLDTLDAAGFQEAYLRIIATRGSGTLGLDPTLAIDPQLIVMALPLPTLPEDLYRRGRSAYLVTVPRNLKDAIDPQAKTGNYMNSVLALREARSQGADEAIMLDHEGRIAEASSANVFAYIGGEWLTPPLSVGILSGITRKTLLELSRKHGIEARECELWPGDLKRATEIFLCSSVRELVPVVELNGEAVGDGSVGNAYKQLLEWYRREVAHQTKR